MNLSPTDLPPIPDDDEALPPIPSAGGREPSNGPTSPEDQDTGPSSLLLDSEAGRLLLPIEDESEPPPLVLPPETKPADHLPHIGEEEGLGVIRLDDLPLETTSESATEPISTEPRPPEEPEGEKPDESEELKLLLMDEEAAPRPTPSPPTEFTQPPAVKSAIADLEDDSAPSALLIGGETATPEHAAAREESPPLFTETTQTLGEDLVEGRSLLLLDTSQVRSPAVRQEEPPVEPERRWRRRRERVRIVPPKPGAEVQWFTNADACAIYCRKHSRPLLLYFTTGDMEQCHSYEEAIRQEQMQPFLCSYVCCMVNLAQAEGRRVAMRLGVPTDGPAMVLLSPSGREYVRVLKPEVDWQFLATMLFWALR